MSINNCIEFKQQLEHAIETKSLFQASALETHALSCSACQELWESNLFLERSIACWQQETINSNLAQNVLTQIELSKKRSANSIPASKKAVRTDVVSSSWKSSLALISTAALLVFILTYSPKTDSQQSASQNLREEQLVQRTNTGQQATNSPKQTSVDSITMCLGLGKNTMAAFADEAILVPTTHITQGLNRSVSDKTLNWAANRLNFELPTFNEHWEPFKKSVDSLFDKM